MSKCPPPVDNSPPPDPQSITGYVYQLSKHPSAGPYDDTDSKLKKMWEVGCTDERIFYLDQNDGVSIAETKGEWNWAVRDKVECRIPDGEWEPTWEQARQLDENPHEFITSPIDWTKSELSSLIKKSIHWWLEVDDPFDTYGDFGAGQRSTWSIQDTIVNSTVFLVGVIAVISLLFVAGRMALQRNTQPARSMLQGLITLVVVTAASYTIIKTLIEASDRFTLYFVSKALYTGGGENVDVETGQVIAPPTPPEPCELLDSAVTGISTQFNNMNFFLFLLCAIFLLVSSVVLYCYMLARVFVITLLTGLLPLAAAGTATEAGKEWFGKMVSRILAFILIKPAATIVFVVGIRLSNGGTSMALDQLTSAIFLFMGTVLLPAMTRFAFPFVSAAARGDKGAQALAVAPVALGAKIVKTGIGRIGR